MLSWRGVAGEPYEPARRSASCAAGLRQELVDVGGDRLVEVELFVVQAEGDGVRVTVREKAADRRCLGGLP